MTHIRAGIVCIRRADGTEPRFTSLDENVVYEPVYDDAIGASGEIVSRLYKGFMMTVDAIEKNPVRKLEEEHKAALEHIKQLKAENEALRRRLQHLLESDYIRSFDEYDPRSHTYKRDIREADRNSVPGASALVSACLRKTAEVVTEVAKVLEKEGRP